MQRVGHSYFDVGEAVVSFPGWRFKLLCFGPILFVPAVETVNEYAEMETLWAQLPVFDYETFHPTRGGHVA